MKENLIGTKAIAQQTPEQKSQAFAQAKLSKAWQRFGSGLGDVRRGSAEVIRETIYR